MLRLTPLSRVPSPSSTVKSMEPKSVGTLPVLRSRSTSVTATSTRLSTLAPPPSHHLRTLDFDIECVAAGFADPAWVPKTVTCWAYAWLDDRQVTVEALPPALFYDKDARRSFLEPLIDVIRSAGVLTGHNIIRFDMPTLNAECHLLGLEPLGAVMVQDTIRIGRTNGFKKGQDNMSHALGVSEEKLSLSWAEWATAYAEPDLATVKARCASDVVMHMEMRDRMSERGWLRTSNWKP